MSESQEAHTEAVRRAKETELPTRKWILRRPVAHFLFALVLLLVTAHFVEQLKNGVLIDAALLTLVLLSAVLAVGGLKRMLIIALVLIMPAVVGTWVDHFRPDLVPKEVTFVASIVFVAFVIGRLLGFIAHTPGVNSEVLCAGMATYLMLGLLWTFAYALVARLIPHSFAFPVGSDTDTELAGFKALYFSFCTLTTVGYGDIVPLSNAARMLAMTEATTGMFFATILIARLVALYSNADATRA
jgi:hypothetical protein